MQNKPYERFYNHRIETKDDIIYEDIKAFQEMQKSVKTIQKSKLQNFLLILTEMGVFAWSLVSFFSALPVQGLILLLSACAFQIGLQVKISLEEIKLKSPREQFEMFKQLKRSSELDRIHNLINEFRLDGRELSAYLNYLNRDYEEKKRKTKQEIVILNDKDQTHSDVQNDLDFEK